MMTYPSKKWSINSEVGFIDVNIEFFIGLEIISQSFYDVQLDFNLVRINTNEGEFIIELNDWREIQNELRSIKIDTILD